MTLLNDNAHKLLGELRLMLWCLREMGITENYLAKANYIAETHFRSYQKQGIDTGLSAVQVEFNADRTRLVIVPYTNVMSAKGAVTV